jgi:hypothetical protein
MSPFAARREAVALLLALFASPPAQALLRFNDGRDQVYVTAYIAAGYDSNIYTRADAEADLILTSGVGLEYTRQAGMIGVDATLAWALNTFSDNPDEDFSRPSASLTFSKSSGRTTGDLRFQARRDSRADPTVGLRTESREYGVDLTLRYPVIERYSLVGTLGWAGTDYVDDTGTFSDLDTYTLGTDLFYRWRSDRDLLAGYRYRAGDAAFSSRSVDHSLYLGVSGRIVSKLNGSARVGYTRRTLRYPGSVPDNTNDGLYVSVASTWPINRRATLTLSAAEDFGTTASNFETRTTTVDLEGRYAHNPKLSSHARIGAGQSEYLNGFGRDASRPVDGFNGRDREDRHLRAGLGASYLLSTHLTLSADYESYRNWSSLRSFEFTRHTLGLTLSTRW